MTTTQPTSALKCLLGALTLCLAACGGSGQDSGTSVEAETQVFRGIAIDGHVARALVFIDLDNNATRDPWEPYAFTDNGGYYSYNPKTDTDYCALDATATESIYCLVSTRAISDAVIRVDGGYDALTGEPFVGQLSKRLAVEKSNPLIESVITPLTTLLTETKTEKDRAIILASLGISEADLNVDYLDTDGLGNINGRLFNKALKIHKVVTILSDQVGDSYGEIGARVGTPNDLSARVYSNLGNAITSALDTEENDSCAGVCLETLLSNADLLSAIALQTEQQAQEIYELREVALPSRNASGSALPNYSRVSDHAVSLTNIVNSLIGDEPTDMALADIVGRARAVESFVIKVLDEDGAAPDADGNRIDNSIENAASFFLNNTNNDLVPALIASLNQPTADLSALARNDFAGEDFDSSEEISSASQLPDDIEPFVNMSGTQLRVSDRDLGRGPDNLKDSEVEAYFYSDTDDATEGSFTACVKYIDGAKSDGSLGEANTRGELVRGYWSLLEADANGESYSLLLTIEFLGATYQSIIKPLGMVTVNNVEDYEFRFDYRNELRTWASVSGVTSSDTLPTSDEECKSRLPSRVGI